MITLAIETSCDETSAAVLSKEKVMSNIISSQLFHSKYGGVVPEVASREHLKKIIDITEESLLKAKTELKDIDLISATSEPGLIGALLVGLNFAKSLSVTLNKPFIPVNHIESHLYSNFLCGQKNEFPFLGLIVSGGHTLLILVEDFFKHKILGRTIDDAAGEAFDKVAKLLSLGYPGGPEIDKYAKTGNKNFHKFPRANIKESEFDFSFSGIKTSVLYFLRKIDFHNVKNETVINDICASFQDAVISSLYQKTLEASEKYGVKIISVSGGVSANSGLREKFNSLRDKGYRVYFPEHEYSTDNAAMVGLTAYLRYKYSKDKDFFYNDSLKQNARARLDYENF
ncbi:MAG: tRNA (adenosine(37)-N6)-threonylcarbamoyltransferase complex transferase subunit TsaD [Ignavibacteria bacterium]